MKGSTSYATLSRPFYANKDKASTDHLSASENSQKPELTHPQTIYHSEMSHPVGNTRMYGGKKFTVDTQTKVKRWMNNIVSQKDRLIDHRNKILCKNIGIVIS